MTNLEILLFIMGPATIILIGFIIVAGLSYLFRDGVFCKGPDELGIRSHVYRKAIISALFLLIGIALIVALHQDAMPMAPGAAAVLVCAVIIGAKMIYVRSLYRTITTVRSKYRLATISNPRGRGFEIRTGATDSSVLGVGHDAVSAWQEAERRIMAS